MIINIPKSLVAQEFYNVKPKNFSWELYTPLYKHCYYTFFENNGYVDVRSREPHDVVAITVAVNDWAKKYKKEVTTLIELADALQKPVIELLPDEGYEIEILEKMPDTGWKTL